MSAENTDRIVEKKLESMKKLLLDTGRRNRMINYRETKRATLRIVTPDYRDLFSRLVFREESLTFRHPVDADYDLRAYSFLTLLKTLGHEITVRIGDIETGAPTPGEQNTTLRNLRSRARLAQEEQGTNILYLSFGFIRWREKNTAGSPYMTSPLVMVPAALTVKALNAPFVLSRYDDDIVVNPTLAYKLEHEYNLVLPEFDPADEKSLDRYFAKIEKIADERGWQLIRDVSLGLVSFLKISMYHDLEKKHDRLVKNRNIRAICGDRNAVLLPPEAGRTDDPDAVRPIDEFQVIDADASQQKAILLSRMGASFVMQGPPGTGKSQTITNIIAEALADGKKVLFVSEKAAALDVVMRRLTEAHISDFCLSLHDYKANKRDVLRQIGQSLRLKKTAVKKSALDDLVRLEKRRDDLNGYARELHEEIPPLNVSLYQVFGEISQFTEPAEFVCEIADAGKVTEDGFREMNCCAERYAQAFAEMSCGYAGNPWRGTAVKTTSMMYLSDLKERTEGLPACLRETDALMAGAPGSGGALAYTLAGVRERIRLYSLVDSIPLHDSGLYRLALPDLKRMLLGAKKARLAQNIYRSAAAECLQVFDESILDAPVETWLKQIRQRLGELRQAACLQAASDGSLMKDADRIAGEALDAERAARAVIGDVKAFRALCGLKAEDGDVRTGEIPCLLPAAGAVAGVSAPLNPRWLTAEGERTAREIIEGAEGACARKKEAEKWIGQRWRAEILEYTYAELRDACLDRLREIGERYTGGRNRQLLAADLARIASEAGRAAELARQCAAAASGIRGCLGMEQADTLREAADAREIAAAVYAAQGILPAWLDGAGREAASGLLREAREKAKARRDKKEALLKEWHEGILALDAAGMISRFRTYGSLFGHMKPQYKTDLQEIMKYAKNRYAAYSDARILRVLAAVLEIRSEDGWVRENESRLREAFGRHFSGEQTDWDHLAYGLECARALDEKIREKGIPAGQVLKVLGSPELLRRVCGLYTSVLTEGAVSELRALLGTFGFADGVSLGGQAVPELGELAGKCAGAAEAVRAAAACRAEKAEDISEEELLLLASALRIRDDAAQWPGDRGAEFGEYLRGGDRGDESFRAEQRRLLDEAAEVRRAVPEQWLTGELVRALCDPEGLRRARSVAERILENRTEGDAAEAVRACRDYAAAGAQDENAAEVFRNMAAVRSAASELTRTVMECNIYAHFDVPAERMAAGLETVLSARDSLQVYRKILAGSPELTRQFGEPEEWTGAVAALEYAAAVSGGKTEARFSPEFVRYFCNDPKARDEIRSAREKLETLYAAAEKGIGEFAGLFPGEEGLKDAPMREIADRYDRCMGHIEQLDMWLNYRDAREACVKCGLEDFAEKMEQLDGKVKDPVGCFRYSFFRRWCRDVIAEKPAVARFRRFARDNTVREFCELDVSQFQTARQRIRSGIIGTFPDPDRPVAAGDEMAVLQRELGKKTKIMPLRKLFRAIPNLLLTLKPCLMMSPLSVSHFLEADSYQFDMVIFDEASQIFPQDALGSIMRGKQVIIAGDTRQLPPTNFFSASTANSDGDYDEEEDEDEAGEAEISDSILEEADSAMYRSTLLWHYRSRNEQLIAFSNREIYENRLITFPGCREQMRDTGVEFVYVKDGLYEGKPKNCNTAEAARCVQLIEEHIRNTPERSLGIIAFSEKQQQAILDAVEEFREKNPQHEAFFREDREDPFFVKNLENVQGDERDTIFFSVGYGYTKEQREQKRAMSLRFGPLGRAGGERRLNVAITRAKINIKLVASILPSDIRLDRTQSEGIRLLHDYLRYAIRGTAALHAPAGDGDRDLMCSVVRDFLEDSGYGVTEQLGCSGYRIDLAVKHPSVPDCYLAAVECDGGPYRTARTARERDRLRRDVLGKMGWNVYRVWSPEWVRNREVEGKKLLDFLKEAEARPFEYRAKDEAETAERRFEEIVEPVPEEPETNAGSRYGFETYREASLYDTPPARKGYPVSLNDHILYVVSVEQPVSMEILCQRIAPHFGSGRATTRVVTAVEAALTGMQNRVEKNDGFVTMKGFLNPVVRIPPEGAEQRAIGNIAPAELMEAMRAVAAGSFGLSSGDLVAETARALGYQRKGPRIQAVLEEILDVLVKREVIRMADGKVHAVEESING